jgi:hypothetical protein
MQPMMKLGAPHTGAPCADVLLSRLIDRELNEFLKMISVAEVEAPAESFETTRPLTPVRFSIVSEELPRASPD